MEGKVVFFYCTLSSLSMSSSLCVLQLPILQKEGIVQVVPDQEVPRHHNYSNFSSKTISNSLFLLF